MGYFIANRGDGGSYGAATSGHHRGGLRYAGFWHVSVLMQIWIWSEFVTMLLNKRRRAVHDYIAGTVVLRT